MSDSSPVRRIPAPGVFANGASIGIGSLPHVDVHAAAAFSVGEFEIATVPTLPARSPEAGMIGQLAAAIPGVRIVDGRPVCDDTFDRSLAEVGSPVDLSTPGYADLHAFLQLGAKINLDGSPVKWQLTGPVTFGRALVDAGVPGERAFEIASAEVQAAVAAVGGVVSEALPSSPQLVLLDEPWLVDLMTDDFPIPPDEAVDRMSSAMAAGPEGARMGVHCCGPCDVATLLASGPSVISLPVADELLDSAGYLARFLDDGGVVSWGVVPTDGPVSDNAHRWWRRLSDLWCALVQRGCDPALLRQQSLVSPQCGLASHSVSVARRIARQTAEVSRHVRDQAAATRLTLGA